MSTTQLSLFVLLLFTSATLVSMTDLSSFQATTKACLYSANFDPETFSACIIEAYSEMNGQTVIIENFGNILIGQVISFTVEREAVIQGMLGATVVNSTALAQMVPALLLGQEQNLGVNGVKQGLEKCIDSSQVALIVADFTNVLGDEQSFIDQLISALYKEIGPPA